MASEMLNGVPLEVGDKIRVFGPPPLTWFDNLLWRSLRIERKREHVWRDMVVVDQYSSDDIDAALKE